MTLKYNKVILNIYIESSKGGIMENSNYKISWLKVMGIIIAFIVVIAIVCMLYPKNNKSNALVNTYINNINLMKEAGFEYFRETNLPEKIGASKEISLEEMIDSKLIMEFVDEDGKTCDVKNSYIKVTKTLDREYAMKVALDCENKSDYIVTSIEEGKCIDCNSSNNNNSSNTNDNNNNSNNSNNNSSSSTGNNNYNPPKYNTNGSNITHITNININYVNSCKGCTNCGNNCLSNVYYSVYFDAQGGDFVPKQTIKQYDTANYVVTTRDGYQFLGWYLNGQEYDFNTPVTKTITLIAKWKKIDTDKPIVNNKHTVYFNTNGGGYIKSQTIFDGNYATRPNDPNKSCYDFAGWYTDSNFNYRYDFDTPVTKDITLYAKWVNNGTCNKYTVSFNTNGAGYIASQTLKNGDYATRPTDPSKSCYDFAGWYTNSSLTTRYNFNTPVTKNITLYAKWVSNDSCINKYTVSYNSNGGNYISSEEVREGNTVSRPSNPRRSGYTFKGWYYNGSTFNFNTRIYRNYTLVAKWEKDEEKYYEYCPIKTKTYYSTNYVNANQSQWSKNWTIKFDDLYGVSNLKITDIGYINSSSMYTKVYQDFANKGISMVNGTGKYGVSITSGSMLQRHSLKSSNFNKYVSAPYSSRGYWYADASISIRNFNNVEKYYASNLGHYVYFTPFYFDVKYTDSNGCVTDLASRSSSYRNYEIVDTFYR